MTPEELIAFLGLVEPLKSVPRHAWTRAGVRETVAAHSWRAALMALLLRQEFPDLDMDKVVSMCLLHDIGEAVTGDIPAFEKNDDHRAVEDRAVAGLLAALPPELQAEYAALFREMEERRTPEARLYKAIDQLEAVLTHNEADLSTWLPLEYELNQVYGKEAAQAFSFTEKLQQVLAADTRKKLRAGGIPTDS